jgi:hypothetical protein
MDEVEDTSGYGEQNDPQIPDSDIDREPAPVDPEVDPGVENGAGEDPAEPVLLNAPDVDSDTDPTTLFTNPSSGGSFSGALFGLGAAGAAAARAVVGTAQARNQMTNAGLNQQPPANTDWRVTLRLAPGATYLYNSASPGLLAPLKVTNGVIFPYTPAITTTYKANYSQYDLTHQTTADIFIKTATPTQSILMQHSQHRVQAMPPMCLAVIHFFRSVTKMFYGQDAQRGSPPPLVFLSGLGDYQFNNHPCLVQSFNYNLPADVDYISSGSPNNLGLNLQPLQNLYSTTLNAVSPTVTRLAAAFCLLVLKTICLHHCKVY